MTQHPPATADTFVISITPFAADGSVDEEALRSHLRRLAAAGVGAYVGGGGSGEGFTLSDEEVRTILCVAVDELGGTVPVRAMGCEPRTVGEMIAYLRLAKECGVEAAQIYSLDVGHGHHPTGHEVEDYFDQALRSTDLPVILSTHKSVGYQMPVSLIGRLVKEYDHLVEVNCSHPDLTYLAELVDTVGGRHRVFVGGPAQTLTALALGADGFLSSEGNLAPRLARSVISLYQQGEVHGLLERFGTLLRLHHVVWGNGGIRATKALLRHYGCPVGDPRPPLQPLTQDVVARLVAMVDEIGVPEIEGWTTA